MNLNEAMRGTHEPRSTSSCAACKLLKRRCTPTCIFAPYFRSDEPKRFANVHKVFGASNVSKILIEVAEEQREDTVNSLVYEAELRLKDPVYGCIGAIAFWQGKMVELQHDLAIAKARLARYTANSSCSSSLSVMNDYIGTKVPYIDDVPGCSGLKENMSQKFVSEINQQENLDCFRNFPYHV